MKARDFKRYLKTLPRGKYVGLTCSNRLNPEAIWLNSLAPADQEMMPWEVTPHSILFNGSWVTDLEPWEQQFQQFIWEQHKGCVITKEMALAWLEVACHGSAQSIAA